MGRHGFRGGWAHFSLGMSAGRRAWVQERNRRTASDGTPFCQTTRVREPRRCFWMIDNRCCMCEGGGKTRGTVRSWSLTKRPCAVAGRGFIQAVEIKGEASAKHCTSWSAGSAQKTSLDLMREPLPASMRGATRNARCLRWRTALPSRVRISTGPMACQIGQPPRCYAHGTQYHDRNEGYFARKGFARWIVRCTNNPSMLRFGG